MRAMILDGPGSQLRLGNVSEPAPAEGEILIRIRACGICRTDLHLLDGELPMARFPVIPGHQIVGIVERTGSSCVEFSEGDRVGVPWLGWTCGECEFCTDQRENLCPRARFTGCNLDGGFAEYVVADERFCFLIPEIWQDTEAAPLLCAGLIGYRSLRLAGEARRVGLYGFGAAAHIVAQLAVYQGREVFGFVRPGDHKGAEFARALGAVWSGGSDQNSPEPLDAAIIFAPIGSLVPKALRDVKPGGVVVCAGIEMSDIPPIPYRDLWMERSIRSVANLTRRDGREFFPLAAAVPVRTRISEYPFEKANDALDDLRHGRFEGAAVLTIRSHPSHTLRANRGLPQWA